MKRIVDTPATKKQTEMIVQLGGVVKQTNREAIIEIKRLLTKTGTAHPWKTVRTI